MLGSSSRTRSIATSSKLMTEMRPPVCAGWPSMAWTTASAAARALISMTRPVAFGEPLEDLWQRRHAKALPGERRARVVGAREARARIGLANLVHRQIGDPPGAVRRPVEGLVVDHRQLAVGGEVDVELDRVGPDLDAQPEGLHRVLGRHPRCPAVGDDDRHAAMPSTSASAAASSLSGSPSGTPRRMTRPTISKPNSDAIAIWYAPRSSVSSSVATIAP